MPECGHNAKHLGFPFCNPESRTQAFGELTEKMTNRMALWKARNLLRAVKMVLIKNVAQALPVYPMSSFILLKKICHKLDAIVRRFWWKTELAENSNHFIALKSWSAICTPKSKGGLGFPKFADINRALFSKIF
ncbi:UNVERIFIED_CONTAM: hypothetical protein Sangu_2794800 [Sesamum angustifolium]|uniref:Reverse transcriptase n=1 Tax=Sesamum angustifolium TaxID=2727405 RepID=A0AAW2IUM9_9LAMI